MLKAMKVSKSVETIDIGKAFIQAMKLMMKKNKVNATTMKSMMKKTRKRHKFIELDWRSGLFLHQKSYWSLLWSSPSFLSITIISTAGFGQPNQKSMMYIAPCEVTT
jgi:hypothetical protein